ncbi:MAG: class I SAM-dependent rRNA methyltransferase [Saprospiraceae bacterium]|nr:class I SAM-dependent rRNA methyltransferase [Saprospiraceae bacterium]
MKRVSLKRNKENILAMQHPWIFSGALLTEGELEDGAWVEIVDRNQRVVATGHYQNHSIAVRILAFGTIPDKEAFYRLRVQEAFQLRRRLGLIRPDSNIFRLIHGEGDLLPGLIIDVYGSTAVIQCHSIGMHLDVPVIASVVSELDGIDQVYDKSQDALPAQYRATMQNGYLVSSPETDAECRENGLSFHVDWEQGQKTGFFIDQRDNRDLVGKWTSGLQVLNAFSYSGGFSMYALAGGATQVVSVDQSRLAIQWANENARLNAFTGHEGICANVFEYLQQTEKTWDMVIIDPPAFAKSLQKKHNAVQAYKRLNILAMQRVKPGGLLFTFSCSQVIDRELFQHTVVSAGMETGRPMQILHALSQGADHPTNLYHPEGHYLKGLAIRIH